MKTGYTHIVYLLDKSGSMQNIITDVIGGFNSFLESQREAPGEATLSMIQFDDQYEDFEPFCDIQKVERLTHKTFVPRGLTALYDAIGRSINATGQKLAEMNEDQRPEKVLFVIMTDGLENKSEKFSKEKIFEMISHQEKQYSWEFVFVGANQDALASGVSLGIAASKSLTFAANSLGVKGVYESLSHSTRMYRAGGAGGSGFSFSEEDRKAQARAGAL